MKPIRCIALTAFALLAVEIFSASCLAQERSLPMIKSPQAGAIVTSGAVLPIQVEIPKGSSYTKVYVGIKGVGVSDVLTSAPYNFSVTIPGDVVGPQEVVAMAFSAPGNGIVSKTTVVDVEQADLSAIISLGAQPRTLGFSYVGDRRSTTFIAKSGGGSQLDVSRSSNLSLKTSDPTVVVVEEDRSFRAVGGGTAMITAQYGPSSTALQVTVPKAINGDLNGDGIVDQTDVAILQAYINTAANGPNDARDLNHDGKIDALDARILTTLCTYPRCASTKP